MKCAKCGHTVKPGDNSTAPRDMMWFCLGCVMLIVLAKFFGPGESVRFLILVIASLSFIIGLGGWITAIWDANATRGPSGERVNGVYCKNCGHVSRAWPWSK